MKSGLKLPDGKWLWMIEFGNCVSSSGWINRLIGKEISEKHIDRNFAFNSHQTYVGAQLNGMRYDASDRVTFDIEKSGSMRKYIFRGVFRLNKEKSSLYENVWDLIADEYSIGTAIS